MNDGDNPINFDHGSVESNQVSKPIILTFPQLQKRRSFIQGKLELFLSFVASFKDNNIPNAIELAELRLRQQSAMTLLSEFNSNQLDLDETISEDEIKLELEIRDKFEGQFYNALAVCEVLLNSNKRHEECAKTNSMAKLPKISLPKFEGNYDNWLEFRDTYLSLIHNSKQLDNIQKFHYLRSSLTGSALQVIKSLEFSNNNYLIAWDLIERRYNNNKLLCHTYIKGLFTLNSITKECPIQLRKMIDSVSKNLRALKLLGEPTDSWDALIIYIVLTKLDSNIEKEWEQFKTNGLGSSKEKIKLEKLEELLNFLSQKADMLEMIKANSSSNNSENKKNYPKSFSHASIQNNINQRAKICNMCKGNHSLYACDKFLALTLNEKYDFVVEKKLCENCLRMNHQAKECYFGPCRKCNKKHNSLLHGTSSRQDSALKSVLIAQTSDTDLTDMSTQSFSFTCNNNALEAVLLSTALIEIKGKDNTYHTARALLDSGSQHCIITNSLSDKLNVSYIQSTYQIAGVGNSITQSSKMCEIEFRALSKDYSKNIKCIVLPFITSSLSLCNTKKLKIPQHIKLADPSFSTEIDILLGANCFWELIIEGKIRLSCGPYLQNTRLGWIVSGPFYTNTKRINKVQCNLSGTIPLEIQLKQFWEIEEILPKTKFMSAEDRASEELFTNTTIRESNGRFSVRIPLKQSADTLGNSYNLAKRQFLALERKLAGSSTLKIMYTKFMTEYLSLGHMNRIENYKFPNFFLPHHGVLREDSLTTKLRVVFNASQKTTSGLSLNDIQMPGPALQNELFAILLRFRQYKYVACGDIEKFFRQIKIQNDQLNLQLILWRENPAEPLNIYQLNTVTYGTTSAPFLCNRCLRQLGLECKDKDVSRTILEDFYVDDLITGNDSKSALKRICQNVADICESGCFPLRKWIFNSTDMLPQVTKTNSEIKYLCLDEDSGSKTLGLGWLNKADQFFFTSKIKDDTSNSSKRSILSTISQIYDPLGLLAPVIIVAKIMIQKLWLCKIGWDDPLPKTIQLNWTSFVKSLSNLSKLRIPRHVKAENIAEVELHVFTDASESAYGACAYIRSYASKSDTIVKLLCSKSRVAPLKPLSIPRLELCGAVMGARLANKIIKILHIKFTKVVIWIDSKIVLGWIKTPPYLLKTFVQNRVVEINELAGESLFLHINGTLNPADLVSRGRSLDQLASCTLWWNGPSFLGKKEFKYATDLNEINQKDLPEMRLKNSKCFALNSDSTSLGKREIIDITRFSIFEKMLVTCTYIFRFIHNIKLKIKTARLSGPLTVEERKIALNYLIIIVQKQSFPIEYHTLSYKSNLTPKNNLSNLNLFLDNNKIIRVGGRLVNSNTFSYDKKHPILLCSKHHFTKILFRSEHIKLLHAGPQLLLSHIRDRWWPLGGRNLAKIIVKRCVTCCKLTGKTLEPIMGNLPKSRLEPGFPFEYCGVDYAGPLYILNRKGKGSKLEKAYLCLFVCLTTKALHLELVTSLSAENYILALKRFISRRGKPTEILSDNGRNFVKAAKDLSLFIKKESSSIIKFSSENNINFKFIPPYSPHFGGLWEAGVKSCRHHIIRVVGNAHLNYEEFSTVLAQIEAVLNSRPMYCLSTDPNDLSTLTPAHFLLGRPLTAPVPDELPNPKISLITRFKRIEQMRQHFWKRWSLEYISELQRRVKWKLISKDLQPNTMVVVKEEDTPPLKWRLGRILEVFPGKDGIARVANIKTSTGIIRRCFSKICPLPINEDCGEDNCNIESTSQGGRKC